MKRYAILVLFISAMSATRANAQGFKGYVAFGFNVTDDYLTESGNSQIGTRMGLNVGPGVLGRINKRLEVGMEMLYSQNGFYAELVQIPGIALDKITVHYVEVPLTLVYHFGLKRTEEKQHYIPTISGGITYARLFDHRIIAVDDMNLSNEVHFDRENALLLNLGMTTFFSKSFAFDVRGTLSRFGEWTSTGRLLYYLNSK